MEYSKQPTEIREKFICEIDKCLDCGMACFLKLDTLEVETVFGSGYDSHYAVDEDGEDSSEAEAFQLFQVPCR